MIESYDDLRKSTLAYIRQQKMGDGGEEIGLYRYSQAAFLPTLYSSAYAAMTRSLYNDLDELNSAEKSAWADYFNRFQDDDGLYRDPVIFNQGWYEGDPLWCGRSHLTCHVLAGLACLGGVAAKPLSFLQPYLQADDLIHWLETRDWGEWVGWSGNEIMNIGTLLQYSRDFHGDDKAGKAVQVLLEWLSTHHINPDTGMWGSLDVNDPLHRSHAVQAAYHWWVLFFYDRYPVPYMERAIDTLLLTQNAVGGFGWGEHNPENPLKSSACEDIDSMDPLARMRAITPYRRDEIDRALERAAAWVQKNQVPDGGFVFMLDVPFEYGHPQLRGECNRGAMFPTWFRTLSLAVADTTVSAAETAIAAVDSVCSRWNFIRCPGYQFSPLAG